MARGDLLIGMVAVILFVFLGRQNTIAASSLDTLPAQERSEQLERVP